MDGAKAAEILIAALGKPCKPTREQMLPSLQAYKCFKKYIKLCHPESESLPLHKQLCAMSLGCIETRYKGTNSVQALELSLNGGFRNVHADVRLSKEKTPVLVRRWHAATYRALGLEAGEGDFQKPLPLKKLMKARYYNRFKPLSLEAFFEKLKGDKRVDGIILSPGCPGNDSFKLILSECNAHYLGAGARLIFLLERQEDVMFYRTMQYPYSLMYHYLEKETPEEALRFCKENGVEYICFKAHFYTAQVQKQCDESGIKAAVLDAERIGEQIYALQNGAVLVGSNCYDVNYLERLMNNEKIN